MAQSVSSGENNQPTNYWLAEFHEVILMQVYTTNIRSVVAKLEHIDRNKPGDQTGCHVAVQTFLRGNRDIHTFLRSTMEIKGHFQLSNAIHAAKARTLVYNIVSHLASFDNGKYEISIFTPRSPGQQSMYEMSQYPAEDAERYMDIAYQYLDLKKLLEKAAEVCWTIEKIYGEKWIFTYPSEEVADYSQYVGGGLYHPKHLGSGRGSGPLSVMDDVIMDGLLHRVGRTIRMDAMKSVAIELMKMLDSVVHDTYKTKGDEANYRILLLWRDQNNGTRRKLHYMLSAALDSGINISIDALDLILDYSPAFTRQGGMMMLDDVITDDVLHRVGRMIRMDAMKSVAIELMEIPDSIVHDTYSTKGDEANYSILLLWRDQNDGRRRQLHHMLSAALDSGIKYQHQYRCTGSYFELFRSSIFLE